MYQLEYIIKPKGKEETNCSMTSEAPGKHLFLLSFEPRGVSDLSLTNKLRYESLDWISYIYTSQDG